MRREPLTGRDLVAVLSYRTAEWAGMRLPRTLGLPLARGYLAFRYRRMKRERETVARNLARVLGEPPDGPLVAAATRRAFDLYGRYWYESFAMRTMPWDEVDRRFRFVRGREHLDEALAQGHGVVAAVPHMGNWDAAAHWLALKGYRMVAVAEELRPQAVFDLFLRHRRALGIEVVPLARDGGAGRALTRALADNKLVALVADRNLSGRGVEVTMFGASRRMPAGPAQLALSAGAPLLPACVYTVEDGWEAVVEPPLSVEPSGSPRADVVALTRALAGRFERFIAAAPSDWHVFQPAWPEDDGDS